MGHPQVLGSNVREFVHPISMGHPQVLGSNVREFVHPISMGHPQVLGSNVREFVHPISVESIELSLASSFPFFYFTIFVKEWQIIMFT
jgi:hypothetical protein